MFVNGNQMVVWRSMTAGLNNAIGETALDSKQLPGGKTIFSSIFIHANEVHLFDFVIDIQISVPRWNGMVWASKY